MKVVIIIILIFILQVFQNNREALNRFYQNLNICRVGRRKLKSCKLLVVLVDNYSATCSSLIQEGGGVHANRGF